MNLGFVGNGNVVLISAGDRVYTDIAARFCRSEKSLEDIIGTPYDKKIVENILNAGHLAATEFDYFIFGVEGYSRVTETQLVRKRMASYLIKSGRVEKHGKRSFDVVLPSTDIATKYFSDYVLINDGFSRLYTEESGEYKPLQIDKPVYIRTNAIPILNIIESWYNNAVAKGAKEEEARYLKPQATEFKAVIGMNAEALIQWFRIRCCQNAQTEIRDLATKMLKLAKEAKPDLFVKAGASCVALGYCPENKFQNSKCKGKVPTHDEVLQMLRERKDVIQNG